MTNDKYIYNEYGDGRAWLDMRKPEMAPMNVYYNGNTFTEEIFNSDKYNFECNLEIYNSRPNYAVHPDLQKMWEKGKSYEEGKDFVLKEDSSRVGIHGGDCDVTITAVPLPVSTAVDELANIHADKLFPNANANDAPYCTTGDRWEEAKESFIAGFNAAKQVGGGK